MKQILVSVKAHGLQRKKDSRQEQYEPTITIQSKNPQHRSKGLDGEFWFGIGHMGSYKYTRRDLLHSYYL